MATTPSSLADIGENNLVEILSFLGYDLSELERLRLVAKSFLKPCDARKAYIHRLFQEVRILFIFSCAELVLCTEVLYVEAMQVSVQKLR